MLRIEGTDSEYIKKLLTEMELDKNICYEIVIDESRRNSEIKEINILARQVDSINF